MNRAQARRRILVLHVGPTASFIQHDVDTLGKHHEVRTVRVSQAAWALMRAVSDARWAEVILCWFGSVRFLPHLVAARALGRPVVVVAGGYDVANLPEIGYGNMRSGALRALGRAVFRLSDVVASLSASAAHETLVNARVPRERIRTVPCAFEADRMGRDLDPAAKAPIVLTVAGINASTLRRKGLLAVARTSRLLPEASFVVAGRYDSSSREAMQKAGGPNLHLPGFVTDAELDLLYRRAKVYFQPSLHEGFGCAVAEAMLYNCIPVVTRRFSLPEVVGPCGLYVEPDDPEGSARVLRRALTGEPPSSPMAPRDWIASQFPATRREEQLLGLLDQAVLRRLG